MHHTIEERHIFPILAKRMPTFRNDEAHIKSHHGIHEGNKNSSLIFNPLEILFPEWTRKTGRRFLLWFTGLDKLGDLIHKWKLQPSTYSPQEMRESLDSWREVLFKHLDEEVRDRSDLVTTWWEPVVGVLPVYFVSGQGPLRGQHEEVLDPRGDGPPTYVT